MLTPGHALAEVIAGRNLGAGDQEQHFFQGTGHPPGLAIIAELCKMPQQHRQSGRCKFRFRSLAHGSGSNESEPRGITRSRLTQNPRLPDCIAVGRSSPQIDC